MTSTKVKITFTVAHDSTHSYIITLPSSHTVTLSPGDHPKSYSTTGTYGVSAKVVSEDSDQSDITIDFEVRSLTVTLDEKKYSEVSYGP